jgi:2,5-diketo-D-gluconate reductase B
MAFKPEGQETLGMTITFTKNFQRAFGTFPLKGNTLSAAIAAALAVGYRAFDTAQWYGNEADTGAALKASGVARKDLCITTKISPQNLGPHTFLSSIEASLKALQIDKVDILLIHWPPADGAIDEPLRLLQQAHAAMMRRAKEIVSVPLVTNQVEFHPLLDQSKLLAAATETGIPLSSYCSVARGEVFKYPIFSEIGAAYGKSAAQIVLRWILQKGVTINTMSTKPENIKANYDVMDFTLSSIDMARIDAMTKTNYRIVTKALVPIAPEFD